MARAFHPTTLANLPDEILLNVCAQSTQLTRNTDLANLSLVSKQLRPIAQEWLLKEPRFDLAHIDSYMWELFNRPNLPCQVRSLEIWSTSDGRVKRDARGLTRNEYPQIKVTEELLQKTRYLQELLTLHINQNDAEALEAIVEDVVPALFCNLLINLPRLQELKVGDAWLMDFPIFERMLSSFTANMLYLPVEWDNTFSLHAYVHLMPRLTVLNVPTDMTSMFFSDLVQAIFDFRPFTALKVLGLSMKALHNSCFKKPATSPQKFLPASLEVLQISEATHVTAEFLSNLCTAKKKGHFPALKLVEVYHQWHLRGCVRRAAVSPATLHPVIDVRNDFKAAKMGLLLHFPPWTFRTWEAGGTPWSLKLHNGALSEAELKVQNEELEGAPNTVGSPTFREEWDHDGDTVMKGSHNGFA
ncbi:hypothetical protein J1614_011446 [Plenodomus biglobosus]|nr:hypothetical protein J1614_011446 [Plenodomus biglobosus]